MKTRIRRVINEDMNNVISPICILWNYTGSIATEFISGTPGLERAVGGNKVCGKQFTNKCQLANPSTCPQQLNPPPVSPYYCSCTIQRGHLRVKP